MDQHERTQKWMEALDGYKEGIFTQEEAMHNLNELTEFNKGGELLDSYGDLVGEVYTVFQTILKTPPECEDFIKYHLYELAENSYHAISDHHNGPTSITFLEIRQRELQALLDKWCPGPMQDHMSVLYPCQEISRYAILVFPDSSWQGDMLKEVLHNLRAELEDSNKFPGVWQSWEQGNTYIGIEFIQFPATTD